jgi:hypothetical protein
LVEFVIVEGSDVSSMNAVTVPNLCDAVNGESLLTKYDVLRGPLFRYSYPEVQSVYDDFLNHPSLDFRPASSLPPPTHLSTSADPILGEGVTRDVKRSFPRSQRLTEARRSTEGALRRNHCTSPSMEFKN